MTVEVEAIKTPFVMSTEENEILQFLKRFPNRYVSVTDISKCVGPRKNFNEDRCWAMPILRRLEMEGHIEASTFGDFRVKSQGDDTTHFLKALETPGMPLGDTTIISFQDLQGDKAGSV